MKRVKVINLARVDELHPLICLSSVLAAKMVGGLFGAPLYQLDRTATRVKFIYLFQLFKGRFAQFISRLL